MKKLLYILFFFSCLATGQTVRYVTVSGAGAHNGTSEANAWTLTEALANDAPNMTIYVKAGNYGATNYTFSTSGTSGNPIKFIGYKTTPGDLASSNGPTFVYGVDSYSTADYPTLVGSRTAHSGSGASVSGGAVTGTAITVSANYVEIHNFQFRNKDRAIYSTGGSNLVIKGNVIHDIGSYTGYSGFAFAFFGDDVRVEDNFIINGGVQAITMGSDANTSNRAEIHYNWIGCDQNIGNDYSKDYYLLGTGLYDSHITNNTVWREPGQYHQGHGIILKSNATGNTLEDNTVLNCPLEFSFEGVHSNVVDGGLIQGTGTEGGNVNYAFILIGNGAHDNVFKNLTITGDVGVRFSDWNDGYTPSPDTDIVSAGYDNLFQNIIFMDLHVGIQFGWQWYGTGIAVDNIFDNCLFFNISTELFTVERGNTGTILRNCVVAHSTATTYEGGNNAEARPAGTNYPLNVTWVNAHAFNNNFSIPGVSEGDDPLFTNAGLDDFTLQSGSPLIDTGSTATTATSDFNGTARDENPDIGPYEFAGGTIDVTGVKTYPTTVETAGATYQLYVDVFPLNADDLTGTWSSDNESVATVNSSGLVTRVGDGQADIQFQSTDGSFTDSSSITFNSGYTNDAIEAVSPVAYFTASSIDPDVTIDGNSISVWEDMSGNGLKAIPQGTIDLNTSAGRQIEFDGTSYLTVADNSVLDFTPGTDEFTLIFREGDVISTAGGYGVSKAGATNRQYGIDYVLGELAEIHVGGVISPLSGVPVGTNRLVIAVITTTTVNVWVDGVQVLTGGTIGTSVNTGQQVNIGGRTNGSYLMSAGSQIDLVAIIDQAIDTAEREAIEDEFNVNSESDNDPVITLLGENPVNILTTDTYVDAGATALDAEDGDLTEDIAVGGDTVDDNTPGTYVITYNVSDSDMNPAPEVTRTVNVSAVNNATIATAGPGGAPYYIQNGTIRYFPQ